MIRMNFSLEPIIGGVRGYTFDTTALRESNSKATARKVSDLYGQINTLNIIEKTAGMEKEEREDFVGNFVIYLGLTSNIQKAKELLTKALQAKAVSEKRNQEVQQILAEGVG